MTELAVILALTIVAPIWIVSHYLTKWKLSKGLSNDDVQMLEDLWKTAQGMEKRVVTLETILDENVKGWRSQV
jgi:phage shock protein B